MTKNKCVACLEIKTIDQFYKSSKNKSGYYYRCKACHQNLNKTWYISNKSLHDERNRKWYVMNKKEHNKKSKQWYELNPDKALNTYLKRYKITLDEFNNLLEAQNYSCFICATHVSKLKIRISVDHCHKTNVVRGLLCQNCNRALGFFKEDPNIIRNAINYLKGTGTK